MALPLSGTLSMSEISVELSYPATQILSLGQEDARQLADVPAGVISISDFYGKSNIVGGAYFLGGIVAVPVNTAANAITTVTQFVFATETGGVLPAVTIPGGPFFNLSGGLRTGTMTSDKAGYASRVYPGPSGNTSLLYKFDFRTQTFGLNVITNPIAPSVAPTYPSIVVVANNSNSLNTETESYTAQAISATFVPNPVGEPSTRGWLKFTFVTESMTWQNANATIPGLNYLNSSPGVQAFPAKTKYGKGFLTGGTAPPNAFPSSNMTSLSFQFSNGTTYYTGMGLTLSGIDYSGSGTQSEDNGYMRTGGGPSPEGWPDYMRRVNFATETSNQFFQYVGARFQTSAAYIIDSHGYFYGGASNNRNDPSTAILPEVNKLSFSTETLSVVPDAGTRPIMKSVSTQSTRTY